MKAGIYKIINVINNKFYVGSAVDLRRRKARHFSELRNNRHNNKHLQAAWLKYGEKSFVFVVVEEIADTAKLLEAENVWLKEHVGKDYCYNLGVDATAPMLGKTGELSPTWGYTHTPEALVKIRQASTGRKHTAATKRRIKNYLIGKPKPAEVRTKISQALSGEKHFYYGKPRDASFIEKVSRRVVVIQPDGTATVYPNIKALREALGIKPPTVNRALKSGLPLTRGPYKGWIFRDVDTPNSAAYTESSGKIRTPDSPD